MVKQSPEGILKYICGHNGWGVALPMWGVALPIKVSEAV